MESLSELYAAAVSSKPTPKVGRGAGSTPTRFGGASTAAPAAAVATAQLGAHPNVGSLLFVHLSMRALGCVDHVPRVGCA